MHRATEGSACSEPSVTASAASGAADSLEPASLWARVRPWEAFGCCWLHGESSFVRRGAAL